MSPVYPGVEIFKTQSWLLGGTTHFLSKCIYKHSICSKNRNAVTFHSFCVRHDMVLLLWCFDLKSVTFICNLLAQRDKLTTAAKQWAHDFTASWSETLRAQRCSNCGPLIGTGQAPGHCVDTPNDRFPPKVPNTQNPQSPTVQWYAVQFSGDLNLTANIYSIFKPYTA